MLYQRHPDLLPLEHVLTDLEDANPQGDEQGRDEERSEVPLAAENAEPAAVRIAAHGL